MTTVLVCIFPKRYLLDSFDEPMYFDNPRDTARCVADIVGHDVDESTEAIIQAIDDYLETHEDSGTWYSFHEFEEVED